MILCPYAHIGRRYDTVYLKGKLTSQWMCVPCSHRKHARTAPHTHKSDRVARVTQIYLTCSVSQAVHTPQCAFLYSHYRGRNTAFWGKQRNFQLIGKLAQKSWLLNPRFFWPKSWGYCDSFCTNPTCR